MTEGITIDIPNRIPLTRIADLLCCGFEGGVGYWCQIVDYTVPAEPRSVWGEDTIYKHVDYPLTGGAVICRDAEGEEEGTWTLDQAAIERGLKLMAEKAPRHWADFLAENEDADTGDCFIQMALLGEIVYG